MYFNSVCVDLSEIGVFPGLCDAIFGHFGQFLPFVAFGVALSNTGRGVELSTACIFFIVKNRRLADCGLPFIVTLCL